MCSARGPRPPPRGCSSGAVPRGARVRLPHPATPSRAERREARPRLPPRARGAPTPGRAPRAHGRCTRTRAARSAPPAPRRRPAARQARRATTSPPAARCRPRSRHPGATPASRPPPAPAARAQPLPVRGPRGNRGQRGEGPQARQSGAGPGPGRVPAHLRQRGSSTAALRTRGARLARQRRAALGTHRLSPAPASPPAHVRLRPPGPGTSMASAPAHSPPAALGHRLPLRMR